MGGDRDKVVRFMDAVGFYAQFTSEKGLESRVKDFAQIDMFEYSKDVRAFALIKLSRLKG